MLNLELDWIRANEKYSHGHRRMDEEKRELMLFILNEGVEEEVSEGIEDEIMELKNLEVLTGTEIELKTIMDFAAKGTMKLKGSFKGK